MGKVVELSERAEYSQEYPVSRLVHGSAKARVVLFCLENEQEISPHISTSEVVMQVIEGEGSILAGEKEHPARRGTIVACASKEPHGFKAAKDKRMVILAVIAPRPGG